MRAGAAATAVIVGGEEGGRWIRGIGRHPRGTGHITAPAPAPDHDHPQQRASELDRLTGLIDAGTVTPSISATNPLDQKRKAMRHLEAGKAQGKIAITS